MIHWLHNMGIRSNHAYAGAGALIVLAFVSWLMSQMKPSNTRAQSDRWGIFVGQWAPTFLGIGVALHLEENGLEQHSQIHKANS